MARFRLPLRPRRIGFATRAPVIFGRPGRRGQVGTAAHFRYTTGADRVGLALGSGVLIGAIGAVLLSSGGIGTAMLALGIGAAASSAALVMIGGPIWIVAHRFGRRGPLAAGVGGAVAGAVLAAIMQAGAIRAAVDPATIGTRWASVAATGVVAAALAAAVALVMWRIAYRRR